MIDRFNAVDTQVLGVSVDSKHSHKNWAESLGGVSYPLLEDFHPKGLMATSYGTYLEDKGFTTRSTVIVDKQGLVQYSVMANGERVISELLGESERFNMVYEEYIKAKDVTRERILLETMASILPKVNKVIADKEVGGNVLPFLPLGQTLDQLNK